MEEMIDPRDTRRLVCEWVEQAWRLVCAPDALRPRGFGFQAVKQARGRELPREREAAAQSTLWMFEEL